MKIERVCVYRKRQQWHRSHGPSTGRRSIAAVRWCKLTPESFREWHLLNVGRDHGRATTSVVLTALPLASRVLLGCLGVLRYVDLADSGCLYKTESSTESLHTSVVLTALPLAGGIVLGGLGILRYIDLADSSCLYKTESSKE